MKGFWKQIQANLDEDMMYCTRKSIIKVRVNGKCCFFCYENRNNISKKKNKMWLNCKHNDHLFLVKTNFQCPNSYSEQKLCFNIV